MVIEAGQLAHQLVVYLAPFVPHLLKWGGEKMGETLLKKGTEDAYAKSKELWSKLEPKVEADASAKAAVTKLAAEPDDSDRQAALRVALKDLLKAEPDFAKEVAALLSKAQPQGNTAFADRGGVAIGGSASGNTITTHYNEPRRE